MFLMLLFLLLLLLLLLLLFLLLCMLRHCAVCICWLVLFTPCFPAAAAAAANVQCVSAGWAFPWGLRVRLCEMLLRGVFDVLDEASYIEGADAYLQLLQVSDKGRDIGLKTRQGTRSIKL
jgi:hypothetical protein